jgi:predicted alpha/beta-fold hydrolase
MSAYRPPRWLPGGHLQTIVPYFLRKAPLPDYRRERVETPDGDFVDLDWVDGLPDAPVVALFHGLEGSSRSHYARALMHALALRRWNGVVAHWRGCSGEANRLPRAYHSGDHAETAWLVEHIASRMPSRPLFAVGVSLGGSALLNWLGRAGVEASRSVRAAAAVSAPLSLRTGGEAIERGFNRVYTWHFLRTMKRKALAKSAAHPGLIDARRVRRSRTLHHFDDAFTAPLHGFADADDYWDRGSALGWLDKIAIPTLILNARNDPFLPLEELPSPLTVSPAVELELTDEGGHVGFMEGPLPGSPMWLPRHLLAFFERHAAADRGATTDALARRLPSRGPARTATGAMDRAA